MTQTQIFKAPISILATALLLGTALTACKAAQTAQDAAPQITETTTKLPPIRKALDCLPQEAAMIAAHRATDKRWKDVAENSLTSLKKLIRHGTLMAELDVAGLKDDTLISFHDGVWDEISTGKGPIAVSTKSDLDTILLKSRAGKLTADRPPLFADMLNTAKGKLYVEVDFKSSANPADVIRAIRDADMADQVLLIAYNPKQAAQFERLAPEMLRSNPPEAAKAGHAVWLGYGVANGDGREAQRLKSKGNIIIGRIGDPNRQPPLTKLINAADILVSDYAQKRDAVIGLKGQERTEYQACMGR